jgi:hypothetical protein
MATDTQVQSRTPKNRKPLCYPLRYPLESSGDQMSTRPREYRDFVGVLGHPAWKGLRVDLDCEMVHLPA